MTRQPFAPGAIEAYRRPSSACRWVRRSLTLLTSAAVIGLVVGYFFGA